MLRGISWFAPIYTGSNECVRCSRDKRTPKLYSTDNNMDPGPIPTQLQVNSQIIRISTFTLNMFTCLFQGLTQVEEMLISAVLHVTLPFTTWAVWLQRSYHQPIPVTAKNLLSAPPFTITYSLNVINSVRRP